MKWYLLFALAPSDKTKNFDNKYNLLLHSQKVNLCDSLL